MEFHKRGWYTKDARSETCCRAAALAFLFHCGLSFPVRHNLGWSWIGFILSSYPFKTNFLQLVLEWILFFPPSIISSSPPFRLVLDLIVLFNKFSSITLFDLDSKKAAKQLTYALQELRSPRKVLLYHRKKQDCLT